MTARLKQDSLERFFSMMRQACGSNSNDHPDSTAFIQLFRLLGTYYLGKPPRGSNVSGGEILHRLISSADISADTPTQQEKFNERLYNALKSGNDFEILHSDHT